MLLPTLNEGVKNLAPKFRPLIVTKSAPLEGMLNDPVRS